MADHFGPYPYEPLGIATVPPSADSQGGFCVTFDKKWLPYLIGLLYTLTADQTWSTDKERVIGEAQNLILAFVQGRDCEGFPPESQGGLQGDDCMGCCLRWNEGKLQCLSCGIWTDVPGASDGPPPSSQPGGGVGLPEAGGGSKRYCGALSGLQKWYLPTAVNSGDVLLFDNLFGAWNDGIELFWHCPDGWLYAAGVCAYTLAYNGGTDPLLGVRHMSIVADIGGTFYDVLNVDNLGTPQPFTVPTGIVDQPVTLQANVDYGGNIYGEVTFCVNVTNNAVVQKTADLNYRAQTGGFVPIIGYDAQPDGIWTPGIGWLPQDAEVVAGNFQRVVDIHLTASGIPVTHIDFTYDLTLGSFPSSGNYVALILINGSIVQSLTVAGAVDGSGQHMVWNGSQNATDIELYIASSYQTSAAYSGSCAITDLDVTYEGNTPPF